MTLDDFLYLADEWQRLGWAVQEQAREIFETGDVSGKNPNAVKMIASFINQLGDAEVEIPDSVYESVLA